MEIDVLIEDPLWKALKLPDLVLQAAEATLAAVSLDHTRFSISVLAAGDARIAELNADFRGKPTPTNVLSWPSEERGAAQPGAMPMLPDPGDGGPPFEIGDIALAYETCAREAQEAGKSMIHHTTHLVVHGIMHCLGFDHESDADAALMEQLETRILATLGVPDPY